MIIVGYRQEQSVPFTLQHSRREIAEWTINVDSDNDDEYRNGECDDDGNERCRVDGDR